MEHKKTVNFDIETLGFFRIAACSPHIAAAAIEENTKAVLAAVKKAEKEGVNLILFPQLVITGCSCGGLFEHSLLIKKAEKTILHIAEKTAKLNIVSAVGFPFLYKNRLYSAMAVIAGGLLYAIIPLRPSEILTPFFDRYTGENTEIPFYKKSGAVKETLLKETKILFGNKIIFNAYKTDGKSGFSFSFFQNRTADLILAPLAEPSFTFSSSILKNEYKELSRSKKTAAVFANCSAGESTGENVFAGECGIFENGKEAAFSSILTNPADSEDFPFVFFDVDTELLKNKKWHARFTEDWRNTEIEIAGLKPAASISKAKTLTGIVRQKPFLPDCDGMHKPFIYKNFFYEIIRLQAAGLAKRLCHIGCKKCVLGVSGGLDSSLALLAVCFCFKNLHLPEKNIYAVTMPCFGTTERTKTNAAALARLLGCTVLEIPIAAAVEQHFADIGHDKALHDTVYENTQARERTQILMDKANQIGALMIGSSDLSEAALGWMTYSGDHISMYEVNASIPKTLLKGCISAFTENKILFKDEKKNAKLKTILENIMDTPVSPELLPPKNGEISQKTEVIIGPYELHDFFLYHVLENGFAPKKIYYLAAKAFSGSKYTGKEILKWLTVFYRRFFSQQFKRACSPEGAAVTGLSLSPRNGKQIPSDASPEIWLSELELLSKIV